MDRKKVRMMSFRLIPHFDPDFAKLSLLDQRAVIKYGRLSRKLEKDIARKRRYVEFLKRRKAQNWEEN